MTQDQQTESLTIILPAGRLPLTIVKESHDIANEFSLKLYLSTAQNLRILQVPKAKIDMIKSRLARHGATFKAPGKFPVPRICISNPHCSLGVVDTKALSSRILEYFSHLETVKAKLKIAISGCVLSCSGTRTSDIGVVASREGFDVYAGGKGGPAPRIGKRIKKQVSEQEVLETMDVLIRFHDSKTGKKQRMYKLLDDPDFPFTEV